MRTPERVARQPELAFRYVVSSTEMRHIERAERRVFVAADSSGLPRIWGEITGCGEACNADLADILLEYSLSTEGSVDAGPGQEASRSFVEQVARSAAAVAAKVTAPPETGARGALEGLLASMGGVPSPPDPSGAAGFDLCPLCSTAASGGTQRVSDRAHILFLDLCQEAVRIAAPGWTPFPTADLRTPGHALRIALRSDQAP